MDAKISRAAVLAWIVLAAAPAWSAEVCASLPREVDAVLRSDGLLFVGEIHGTNEIPAVVGELACIAGRRHAVRLGLEIPVEELEHVDRFLATGDEAQLLAGAFWRSKYQDGRRSRAMLQLLGRVRALRHAGMKIELVLFDQAAHRDAESRERAMADRVLAVRERAPEDVFILLAGNVHARTVRGAPWDPHLVPMGALLAERASVTSVDVAYSGGSAWFCRGDGVESCRARSLKGRDQGTAIKLTLHPAVDKHGYHGELYMGAVSASPPALSQ